ncbi:MULTISPECIES: MucBP domain-containing protein [unclassified Enterococcus]|uniref:MucBP domain-containing protein n=1 Tax=unclassified Enterococcus TaxID=2608891 RepID=UPI002475826C|nr:MULTISPECIES: MucBP domain-containing protein [unclassified Enterococcus]
MLALVSGLLLITTPNEAATVPAVTTPGELTTAIVNAPANEETIIPIAIPTDIHSFGSFSIPADKNIVLDGQDRTYSDTNTLLRVEVSGKLTIKNLRINGGTSGILAAAKTAGSQIIFDNVDFQNIAGTTIDGAAIQFETHNSSANVTIQNSSFKANTVNANGYSGGAIATKNHNGSFTVINNTFKDNKTLTTGTNVGGEGGAIYIFQPKAGSSTTFKDNYFYKNVAVESPSANGKLADGGAIALWNVKANTNVLFDGNTFEENIAGDDGGAVLIQTQDTISDGIIFNNNTFYGNKALGADASSNSGGAIQVFANSAGTSQYTARIQYYNNTFVNNVAKYNGGAIGHNGHLAFIKPSFYYNVSAGYYVNNIFINNSAQGNTNDKKSNIADQSNVPNTGNISNNLGYDNGTPVAETLADVFGTAAIELVPNYSNIQAGATYDLQRIVIPTLPIAPEKLADNIIADLTGAPAVDQRDFPRASPADIGAVEISWIKYDVNHEDAYFELSALTDYDGTIYYEGENPDTYYQVGYDNLTVTTNAPEPKKTGTDEFLGWSINPAATVPDTGLAKADLPTSLVVGDQTLYAVWGTSTLTVTYDANGGTGTTPVDSNAYNVGDSTTLLAEGDLVKDGYRFVGWTLNAPDVDPVYTVGSQIENLQNSITLYAKWEILQPAAITVEYWEYDINGNPVEKIAEDIILTGNLGDRYHAEANYIIGYTFNGVVTADDLSPISGIISDQAQTVKLSYHKLEANTNQGFVLAQYQDEKGTPISADILQTGDAGAEYSTTQKEITGYTFTEVIGNPTGLFTNEVIVVTYVYKSNSNPGNPGNPGNPSNPDTTVPDEVLIPIWRAYNLNDGDHLYTTSKEEYDWIVGLGWQAESVAFYSVTPSYQQAKPVYRLYNPNSGEHFYTLDANEYEAVATEGWNKEGIAFYMVPEELGYPIYRVFNPYATGPGSHLFTRSRFEADWLIGLGWQDEGIAFYSAR